MSDDRELADLLGEAPSGAGDPSFRFDVLTRVAERRRQRAARGRALNQVAVCVAIGALFPVLQAAGLNWADAQPMAIAVAALTVAGAAALLTILGPGVVLARARALLRGPSLRA